MQIKVEFFWAVTPCSILVGRQRFGGPRCLYFQGEVTGPQDGGSMDLWNVGILP
jgi:hypothetical protein